MREIRVSSLINLVAVWIEFVIASMVVYLDPGDNDFPYTKLVFSYPGVLEEIHRIWALVILVAMLYTLSVALSKRSLAPGGYLKIACVTAALFVLQVSFGAITIWSYDYPPYVILHEGNASLLMFTSALLFAKAWMTS